MSNQISNTDNTIDSRDVIARIEELEAEEELDEFDAKELAALKYLQLQAENYSDWEDGAQLINESYFEEAMDELIADIGDIPRDLPSYLTIAIDYDALKQDYTEVEFDGTTFLMRE